MKTDNDVTAGPLEKKMREILKDCEEVESMMEIVDELRKIVELENKKKDDDSTQQDQLEGEQG